uniref:N,O-diacetylmuramidase n=1 Tax=Onygena equina TaxID=45433 RepID=A0A7S6G7S4_9EURO|nr:GH25 muramidase [Onygena equina]
MLKTIIYTTLAVASLASAAVPGIDVSGYQGNVNWANVANAGKKFAYVKATEHTNYINPYFAQQYNGAYNQGIIRGAYHYAHPNGASGASQANYFLAHGGGWSADGKTLPGAVDLEYGPNGSTCWGISQSAMIAWIRDFSNTYRAKTGRPPVIYTSTSWWKTCTGNYGGFGNDNPLWIARYSSTVGELPAGWPFHSIWQNNDNSGVGGDGDIWNGDLAGLQRFAKG